MRYLLISLLALTLTACTSSKEAYLHDFDRFMETVQAEQSDYNEADWADRNAELQTLLEVDYPAYEAEMTPEEKAHLWTQVFTYHFLQYQDRALQALSQNQDTYVRLMEENAEFITLMGDEFTREILPELEKTMPEFQRLGEDLMQRLEQNGSLDRLQKAAEEWAKQMESLPEGN